MNGFNNFTLKGSFMKVKVYVTLKNGILDPQGKAVHHSLESIGFTEVSDVRQGKLFELTFNDGISKELAEQKAAEMAKTILANTVMENFRVEVE